MKRHSQQTVILILLLFVCMNCNPGIQNHQNDKDKSGNPTTDTTEKSGIVNNDLSNNDSIEDRLIDMVYHLPEIKSESALIEKASGGKNHLTIWVAANPDSVDRFYWIKAGEDNGNSLVTHFDFHVYPDSMRIMYYDLINDEELSLDKWRSKKE